MKTLAKMRTIGIIAFMILLSNIKAQDTAKVIWGPHGGILKSAEHYKVEMLVTYDRVYSYIYNRNDISIPNKDITGDITFFFEDAASLNKKLSPYESDAFVVDVVYTNYSYCTIHFNVKGEDVITKFENQQELAKKEKQK